MSTDTERKHLISSVCSLRTMERLHCSQESCAATAQLVEANIDALIAAAKREVIREEQAVLALAATIADGEA
jgi:hypothetical protein